MPMFFRKREDGARPGFLHRLLGPTLGGIAVFVLELVQIAVLALAIILPVRYFLIQPFIVKGASMEENFFDNEYLIIDEISYRFRAIERGEVVVVRPPNNESQFYIKRVIALPGERILIKNGTVTIYNVDSPNGFTLDETYLSEPTTGRYDVTLGLDEYYILGDNRDASLDSRVFGPLKRDHIVGRVWIRGLPLDRAGAIEVPSYNP